jgi:hypothetical protein
VDDAADYTSVIDARLASGIGRKMRFKPTKLSVGEPKITLIHLRSPFQELESEFAAVGNPVYGS